MSHWNYRMTRETVEQPDGTKAYLFAVREVHYGPGDELRWSKHPSAPQGDTWMELADALSKYTGDTINHPVLDLDTGKWIKQGQSADRRPTDDGADAS